MGFKSALGGFQIGLGRLAGYRLAWLFQVLGCGLPVAMGVVGLLVLLSVDLGFDGLCSPLYPPPPSLTP